MDLLGADGKPGAQVLHLPMADRQQGLSMGHRQVRLLLGGIFTPLQYQAAAGFRDLHSDLHISAALRLAGEVALEYTLASPLLPDQARTDGARMNRRCIGRRRESLRGC